MARDLLSKRHMENDGAAPEMALRATHVYAHDPKTFEGDLNAALERILGERGVVGDIKYVIDPSTSENQRGGFGALVIYEVPKYREIR